MSNKKLSDILFEAADIVGEGWTRSVMVDTIDGKTCYCALGAIACAKTGQRYAPGVTNLYPLVRDDEAVAELAADLGRPSTHWTPPYEWIYGWNDNEYRTPDEVQAQLRSTAERLAAAGR